MVVRPSVPNAGSGNPFAFSRASATWELAPLEEYAQGRALAWIDDSLDESCYEWARRRQADGDPTLLVPTESQLGLEEVHLEALVAWARGLVRETGEAA